MLLLAFFFDEMMKDNLFADFQTLLVEIDKVFTMMKQDFPAEVRCEPGCVDCCNACYDVSFMEAAYIRTSLDPAAVHDQGVMKRIIDRAYDAKKCVDERLESIRPDNLSREQLLSHMSRWRIRCPMLTDENICAVYEYRPITCRVYGLPTLIGGHGHVCGYSGFDAGKTYPTIKLDKIWDYLRILSETLAEKMGRSEPGMGCRRFFLHDVILGTTDPNLSLQPPLPCP